MTLQACDVICEFNNLTLKEKEKESSEHKICSANLFEIVADNKMSGGEAAVSATLQILMIIGDIGNIGF